MTELLEFAAFTAVPALGLILGAVYSLREIYLIGETRIYIVVLILGFMLFHQTGEMAYFFANGAFRDPVVGEIPETAANLIAGGSVYYVLAFMREERRLNEELEASQADLESVNERLELIFDNVNDGILLVDLDEETIVEANRPAHTLLRYEQNELEGLSPYDIHPHEPERFRELTDVLQPDGGVISEDLSCRRKDGSTMPAAVSASRTTLEGTDLLLVTIRDNTARERYRTQVDLLGRVLRHNLRNDMNVVIGSLGSIEEKSDDPDVQRLAGRCLTTCHDLIDTGEKTRKLNEVLDSEFSQLGVVTDIVPVVERVVEQYDREYPAADIETGFPASARVQASENIVWAVENVVENAVVHAEGDPRVRVTVTRETLEDAGRESQWTTVTVADAGPGIPAAEVAVLRDDTNRTPTEHGSGLGLWIVQQLVAVFDGHLDIDRSPDSAFTTEVSMRLQPGASGYAPERADHP